VNLNSRINTLIMRGMSASDARYQALSEQGNALAGLIAAFDTERERIERNSLNHAAWIIFSDAADDKAI
jgi:hypothetical protein